MPCTRQQQLIYPNGLQLSIHFLFFCRYYEALYVTKAVLGSHCMQQVAQKQMQHVSCCAAHHVPVTLAMGNLSLYIRSPSFMRSWTSVQFCTFQTRTISVFCSNQTMLCELSEVPEGTDTREGCVTASKLVSHREGCLSKSAPERAS